MTKNGEVEDTTGHPISGLYAPSEIVGGHDYYVGAPHGSHVWRRHRPTTR
jgi:hypothetical protein